MDHYLPLLIELPDEHATERLAEDLALVVRKGDAIALKGDLGAGKSTLSRALLRALADNPDLEVPSPTFTLVQSYEFDHLHVAHLDLYRIEDECEVSELGFEEALEVGAALIEWPERAISALPHDALWLEISQGPVPEARIVHLSAQGGGWDERLKRTFSIRTFLETSGRGHAERRFLLGDASARSYEKIRDGNQNAILMNAPRRPDGQPVRNGLPYSAIAHLAEDVFPFVAVDHGLREKGFCAPEIFASDLENGLLLIENLGRETIAPDGVAIEERYEAAIDLLVDFHGIAWPTTVSTGAGQSYSMPFYDKQALEIEADLYLDWHVPHVTGGKASIGAAETFKQLWAEQFEWLDQTEKSWVLRDYHSPNIIWREGLSGNARLGLIDFQDAVIGPSPYDVASLAQDARVDISPELELDLVERYCAGRRLRQLSFDRSDFDRAYAILAAHRATKILGIFVRLAKRDGKTGYLRHLPRMQDYLERSLRHSALDEIAGWYTSNGPRSARS